MRVEEEEEATPLLTTASPELRAMEEEEEPQQQQVVVKKGVKKVFLVISCILLCLGGVGGPLFLRLYFVHGGKRVWFSSFLETAGFPILLVPLAVDYVRSGRRMPMIKPTLFLGSAVVGILTGVDDYLYAYGVGRLPVSTSALIIASQLAFTAGFAFVLVRQKFTAFSVNAVVLLTIGAGVLALHSSGDRPAGESSKEYLVGFLMTLGAAMLYGFMLPLVELLYSKTMQPPTYMMLLQSQFVISLFATLFCFAGMLINHDLKVIGREAREYEVGEVKYYVVVVGNAIMWQAFFLGAIGVIVCASSLLSGILIALLIPVTEVCAVIFFKESFHAEKGLSLLLSLWGFVSYFYGEFKHLKKLKKNTQTHVPPPLVDNP